MRHGIVSAAMPLHRLMLTGTAVETVHQSTKEYFRKIDSNTRAVPAGTELRFEGESMDFCIWILSGWVGLAKRMHDGRRQLIDVVLPIDLLASTSADCETAPYNITALTNVVVAWAPRSDLLRQRWEDPLLDAFLASLESAAVARRAERMLRLGKGTAYEKVGHALLELYLRLEASNLVNDSHFVLPISQHEIGDLTGLTNIHVCRTLRRLSNNGVVEQRGDKVVILDIARLADFCEIDLDVFKAEILPAEAAGKSKCA